MDLNEFAFLVRDKIGELLLTYDVYDIVVTDVFKNNGVKYKGIVISIKGRDAAPTIYMDYYYRLYKQGKQFDEILKAVYENYVYSLDRLELTEKEAGNLCDYKNNLFIKLVNYEKNKNRLVECPFIPFKDLAVTFRYLVHKDDKDVSSAMVNNSLMDMWGIDTKTIYKTAYENTKRLFPPVIRKLSDILMEKSTKEIFIPDNNIYVLTNNCGVNGAAYIIYKELLEDFYERNEKGFYIIPSSVHELIIIPEDMECDRELLKKYVKEVNEFSVAKVDYLSDNVYYFNKTEGIITI